MAWTFNNTTKVLTSTGGTLALPDSLLAGIAAIQVLDVASGYVNGLVGWINNVFISITAGSYIQFDADSQIEFRGSTYLKLQGTTGGGIIHNFRSKLIIKTSTSRTDAAVSLPTGSTFKCLRERPNDPNPAIIYYQTARHDYPTILVSAIPALIEIAGLDCYSNTPTPSSYKFYFGLATTASINNVRIFNVGGSEFQKFKTTLSNSYIEAIIPASDNSSAAGNINVENYPTFYLSTPASATGFIRYATFLWRNATFLNNCWNRSVPFNLNPPASISKISNVYTYNHFFKYGLIVLEDVNVRFIRTIKVQGGVCSWSIPNGSTITVTSNVNGTYALIDLLDCYREGTSVSDYQIFKFDCKARKYDYKSAADSLFIDKELYKGSVNMANGYSDEVQMLQVPHLTLTAVQAAALTGISIAASGTTNGTVTISQNRTVAEIWQYYRYWISQFANFNSVDSWNFDNSTLDLGNWNLITSSIITGNIKTTALVTINSGGNINGVYTDNTGINIRIQSLNILSGSRVQLYNLTNSVELFNGVLSTSGFNYSTTYTSSITCRLRITKVGYLPIELTGVVTNTGLLFSGDNQITDTIYNTIGIDGSTVTEFSTDYVNLQIDVSDLDYQTTFQRLYAWFRYIETTSLGVSNYFNGLYATDEVNFVVRSAIVSLKLDNVLTTPVKITGGALTRDDGQTIIASTSNSIQIDPAKSYIANSQLIVDKLNNIPTNTLTVPKFLALK
jgi:hypothetical protein